MGKHLLLLALTVYACATAPTRPTAPPEKNATPLAWAHILTTGQSPPRLSTQTHSLHGKRVRMVGYMAHLELAPRDGFFLSPTKVHGDEMGAGTGDLPLLHVRVLLRPVPAVLPDVEGPVAVEGRLEVGPQEDQDGRLSHLRLVVEADAESPRSETTN